MDLVAELFPEIMRRAAGPIAPAPGGRAGCTARRADRLVDSKDDVGNAGLAAVMQRVDVGHVEAGLRTDNLYNPFPEEINRRVTGSVARYHFAPTERSVATLRAENVPSEWIYLTGNTVIDALRMTLERDVKLDLPCVDRLDESGRRLILVTAHRRESFGTPFESLCRALRAIAEHNPDFHPYLIDEKDDGVRFRDRTG